MGFFCNNCSNEAKFFCGRCKVDMYCSPLCQKLAFPQHRFHCFTLPSLMPLEGAKQAFFDVVVNHLTMLEITNTPHIKNDTEYQALVNMKVPQLEPTAIEQNEEPVEAAKITSAKTLIDEEEIEKQPPPLVIQKKPEAVPPKISRDEEIVKLPAETRELEKMQTPLEIQKKREPVAKPVQPVIEENVIQKTAAPELEKKDVPPKKPVNTFETSEAKASKKSWAEAFNANMKSQMNTPKPKLEVPAVPKRIFYSELGYRDFKDGEHSVSIAGGDPETKLLYVLEPFEGIEKFMADVENAIKATVAKDTSNGYNPQIEEMVLAKFENVYYRAVVTEDNEGKSFKVLFIDYGNSETVKPTEIKPFNKSLMMDVIIQEVYIENLPVPLTKKAVALIGDEKGIKIKVDGFTESGSFKATLFGL